MEIRFNVTGAERKKLVEAISGIVGWAAVYMKAPTFAYVVLNYTIDKSGTLICDERTDSGVVHSLLTKLVGLGFVYEDIFGEDTPAEAPLPKDSETVSASKIVSGDGTPGRMVIEVPLESFTDTALDNIEKLVVSKATLIMKAVGADSLSIIRESDRLCFPWFTLGLSPEEIHAYSQFIHALCEMAKTQKRVVAKEKPADSEKFAFRCFLLRLGFIGSEYAAARKVLLRNLSGDSSFKSGKRKERNAGEAALQAANTADSGAETEGEGESGADSAEIRGEDEAHA